MGKLPGASRRPSSAGEAETKADNGPFPPWAASEQGLHGGLWGPLLFPVLAAGLLASRTWAGSRLGISSPPPGRPSQATVAAL